MDARYSETDLGSAVRRLELPEEFLRRMIKKLLDSDLLAQAREAFDAGKREDLTRHMHTVKGSAANLGLTGLSAFARDSEARLKAGEAAPSELIEELTTLWKDLRLEFG